MFKPMPYKILVRLIEDQKKTSGLIIPEKKHKDQEPVLKAEVVSVGNYVEDVAVGDTVLIRGHSGDWIDPDTFHDKAVYRILDEEEMIALVEFGRNNARRN